ncbi:hypothetical protein EON73_04305 [bacterium]|nr:MAG: hypothetical protein EON73_04305 [bacterium]
MSKTLSFVDKRRQEIDAANALSKVGHKRWKIISENNGENATFWKQLFILGSSIHQKTIVKNDVSSHVHSLNFVTCTDELYKELIPILVNNEQH